MKELVVVSGKGGTGKTSIVASFAALAGDAVLADCDVDAADLHLVLAPDIKRREEFRAGRVARIRQEDCTGCGACLARCRFDAVTRKSGEEGTWEFSIDEIACEGCGVCVWSCHAEAIDFSEKVAGEWFISDTRHGPMVHARLGIAEENSGKLVTRIRKEAAAMAKDNGRDLVIVDGSPGIGCPVIASMTGADLALIVTEPTVSGLHDFGRISNLAAKLRVPAAVCVNKWDLNPLMTETIEEGALAGELAVLGGIPYDPDVTRAQIEGKSVVEASRGPAAKAIRRVWQGTADLLQGTGRHAVAKERSNG